MKKEIWYEVFRSISKQEGTITIGTFDSLKEARNFKKENLPLYKKLYIDKWTIKNGFPQPIREFN
jgi:hypothetical protein